MLEKNGKTGRSVETEPMQVGPFRYDVLTLSLHWETSPPTRDQNGAYTQTYFTSAQLVQMSKLKLMGLEVASCAILLRYVYT
jgi:hypothetical protein